VAEGAFLATGMKDSIHAGQPIGHAEGPIEFKVIAGPVEYLGTGRFRSLFTGRLDRRAGAVLMAYHPGDDTYRYAEHPGFFGVPMGVTTGKEQTIDFPAIGDANSGGLIDLTATSDSGLPVEYAVLSGPGVIEDGTKLRICDVPVRARLPMTVTVVAWQWGTEGEDGYKRAEPVERAVAVVAP
jgi:hypothetical protein